MTMRLFPNTNMRQAAIITALTTFHSRSKSGGDAIMLLSRFHYHSPSCRYYYLQNARQHHRRGHHHQTIASVGIRKAASLGTLSFWRVRNLSSSLRAQACNVDIDPEQQNNIELPQKSGDRNGLLRYVVLADDGHPLRLYARAPRQHHRTAINSGNRNNYDGGFNTYSKLTSASMEFISSNDNSNNISNLQQQQQQQRSILLLHGRTWSSQPVFDLRTSDDDDKRQSTLQSLADLGFAAYALDLRGFGETPRDYRFYNNDEGDHVVNPINDGQRSTINDSYDDKNQQSKSGGYTTPMRCVADVKCAIDWITKRHVPAATNEDSLIDSDDYSNMCINTKPALLGWSQGALVAQMYAQLHGPTTLSDLILFGSIYDPKTIYPRKPLYHNFELSHAQQQQTIVAVAPEKANTEVAALEDFTLPGTICDEAASAFSTLALKVDPIKAAWDDLHEFNICNPALVHVPTLVMAGSQDPYVSWDAQRELFDRLGTEDKAMCILPGCDHAAHILKARRMFIRAVAGFLSRKDEF